MRVLACGGRDFMLACVLSKLHASFHFSTLIHGAAAGLVRNERMLREGKPDLVVAFPGGRGTADMLTRARAAKVRTIEIANDGTLSER